MENGSVRKGEGCDGMRGGVGDPQRLVHTPMSEILKNTVVAELS